MSRNLTHFLTALEPSSPPTALALLKEVIEGGGEIGDEERRRAAELSGLPEAVVHGVSTFYDDLRRPRGRRHVSVCTGTACWAADFGAHVCEATRQINDFGPKRAVVLMMDRDDVFDALNAHGSSGSIPASLGIRLVRFRL